MNVYFGLVCFDFAILYLTQKWLRHYWKKPNLINFKKKHSFFMDLLLNE